jgi:arylesterase/paraoxonase
MLDKKKPLKVVKVIGIVLLVLGAVVIAFGLKTWKDAGEFKTLDYHSDLNCKAVGGVESSEDITIDPETGMAFISSVARGLDRDKSEPAHGAIFGYDLKSGNPQLVNLTPGIDKKLDGGFFPHGIALYIADDGAGSLFVINHRTNGDFVEIFDYKDGALKHRRSVSGDLMHNPNDLLAVGPDTFYVGNDHGARTFNGQILEDFLKLPKAYVLFFDGKQFRTVAEGLRYTNGFAMDRDGKTLYVGETTGRSVRTYERDPKTNGLKLKDILDLDTGVDNLEMDADGNIWVGAHPRLMTFIKHAKDVSKPSPSQIIKLTPKQGGGFDVKDVHLEDGIQLPASSVAAPYKNKVLIGLVFAPKFGVCEIK